jgi:hypothetical protein
MSISSPDRVHPLLAAVRSVHESLDQVAGTDAMYAATSDKADLLMEITRAVTRLSAMRADVLAVADDVAERGIARIPGAWLAREAPVDAGRDRRGAAGSRSARPVAAGR